MKKIECYIRPEKLEPVKDGLEEIGVQGISIHKVKGHGAQKGITLVGRSGSFCVEWIDKLKLEMVVSDTVDIDNVIDIIIEKAKTGKIGDGKIFITPVSDAIRIRTKERGESIL